MKETLKEILLVVGGALFGIGGFFLLASISEQTALNPILIFEVFRPMAFYLIFGIIAIVGIILLGVGMLKCE